MLNLQFWRNATTKDNAVSAPTARISTREQALSQVKSGKVVRITGFGKLASSQRQHLQAYGLLPGRTIQVLAQHPVTLVLVEQTELAFEKEIARQVFIE